MTKYYIRVIICITFIILYFHTIMTRFCHEREDNTFSSKIPRDFRGVSGSRGFLLKGSNISPGSEADAGKISGANVFNKSTSSDSGSDPVTLMLNKWAVRGEVVGYKLHGK